MWGETEEAIATLDRDRGDHFKEVGLKSLAKTNKH